MKPNLSFAATLCAAAVVTAGFAPSRATAQKLDRSKRPTVLASNSFKTPKIESFTLENGIKVAVVENHSLPLVSVRTAWSVTSLNDPENKEGLSQILNTMFAEGTTTKSAEQLSEAFADLGTNISQFGFTTVTAQVDRSLSLLADMLMHPALPADALERNKANTAAQLRRVKEQPSFVANRIFAAQAYGIGHPFKRGASEESVTGITRDDVVQFHGDWYGPQNLKIVLAGDIKPATARAAVERALGQWKRSPKTAIFDQPPPKSAEARTIYLYDRPNSPQSTIIVGSVGPRRDSPDVFAFETLNTVFGGLSGSRLNQDLREKHAYTYGANSGLQWRHPPLPGTFISQSDVVATKTDSALIAWMQELTDIGGARPATDAEMDFARTNRVAGLPSRFEGAGQEAFTVSDLLQNDLSFDYYTTYAETISKLTSADLSAAAQKLIDPAHMAIVVVGDRKVIEPGLRKSNVAPIVIVDENGRPILTP